MPPAAAPPLMTHLMPTAAPANKDTCRCSPPPSRPGGDNCEPCADVCSQSVTHTIYGQRHHRFRRVMLVLPTRTCVSTACVLLLQRASIRAGETQVQASPDKTDTAQ